MQNRELVSLYTPQVESSTVVQFSQPAKKETGIIVHVLYTYGPISGYTSVSFLQLIC